MKKQTIEQQKDTLCNFIAGNQRNVWLQFGPMAAYLRKARRLVPCGPEEGDGGYLEVRSLDVANVTIENDSDKGQGTFTAWLSMAEEVTLNLGMNIVMVECVQNIRLEKFLLHHGYSRQTWGGGADDLPGNWYKRVDKLVLHDGHTQQQHFEKIKAMNHEELASLWRFAISGHPYFDRRLPYVEFFKERLNSLGGMNTKVSKKIGW